MRMYVCPMTCVGGDGVKGNNNVYQDRFTGIVKVCICDGVCMNTKSVHEVGNVV